MKRRRFLRSAGAMVSLPAICAALDEESAAGHKRLVLIANGFGMLPDAGFPQQVGDGF